MPWLTGWVITGIMMILASRSSAKAPTPTPLPDKGLLSQSMIDKVITADAPGCATAVGDQGVKAWQGSRGVGELEVGVTITESTAFDNGPVAKQFTATTILLLAADGGSPWAITCPTTSVGCRRAETK